MNESVCVTVKEFPSDRYRQDWTKGLTVAPETQAKINELSHFWMRGTQDGWRWVQTADLEDVDDVTDLPTINQLLLELTECDPGIFVSYYPGFLLPVDDYFENVLRATPEFEMLLVGHDHEAIMNDAFRAYHDGWVSAVREYRELVFIETFSNTPEDWVKGTLKRPCTSIRTPPAPRDA